MSDEVKPYGFNPPFERQAIALACCDKSFFGRIGYALEPDALALEPTKTALLAAQAIGREIGHGPASTVLVVQRLRRWMSEGKVTIEQIDSVLDMFDDVFDSGLPSVESVVNEIAPVLKKRLRHAAVRTAMAEQAKRGDFNAVRDILNKADALGVQDTSIGTTVGSEGFAAINELKNLLRLPTGVKELDAEIDGGMPCGGLSVVVGSSGAGKSVFVTHATAANVRQGALCAYATLELPAGIVLARINSNLTGIPINSLLNGKMDDARQRLEAIPNLGPCVVKDFPARATTNEDVFDWARQIEDKYGRRIDLLVFDMFDHITAKVKDANSYEIGRVVSTGQIQWAKANRSVVLSAVHSKGRNETKSTGRKRKLDLGDVADSIYRVRNADLVLTLNNDESNEEVSIHVAKHRLGKARMVVGPLPTGFDCGMLTPIGVI